ncbi:MAG: HDIG domain-containing protein [Bacteroidetes bacterium]|nr:HDIG domain-containing protein [Bacteroidota bacterium]
MNFLAFIQSKHNLIFKLAIVFVCSVGIVLMLPSKQVKGLRVGSFDAIWAGPDLVAEEDFFLKKSIDEIEQEKKAIEAESPLFFEERIDERTKKQNDLETLKQNNQKAYQVLKPIFDSIYESGVIESLDTASQRRQIFIVNGNFAEAGIYFNFFTIKSAANYIAEEINKKNIQLNINYLDFLCINYFFNKEKTAFYLNSKLDQVSVYKTAVLKGQTLVKRGEPLTNNKRFLINHYFYLQNNTGGSSVIKLFFRWLLVFLILIVLLCYLLFFRKLIFGQNKQIVFLYLIVTVSVLSTFVFSKYGLLVLALPFALVPILVRVFFDSRTALFTHLLVVLICSLFMADKLEFILLQLLSGIGTLFTIAEMRKRQQIVNAAALVFIFYVLIFVSYQVGFGTPQLVKKISVYVPFAVSSVLVLLAYPIILLTEKIFGFISDFKLLELSDLNQPLLRQLSQEVPGTFQHSLQVANLAEEAIYYIGGNTLLVRTGAMYHDIGKIKNPNFFTENQAKSYSPHQEMDPAESAKIIINHVIVGVELAKANKLPEQIIDFIRTHHGTTYVGYFLNLMKEQNASKAVNESEFRYPGPIPFSKETAVLMMADGVEAASRSLKSHDALSINELVDTIIDYKIAQNQFINSDITFKDITTIRKIFKKRLMNIYHARIEYPI